MQQAEGFKAIAEELRALNEQVRQLHATMQRILDRMEESRGSPG